MQYTVYIVILRFIAPLSRPLRFVFNDEIDVHFALTAPRSIHSGNRSAQVA
jgi:hypothetical protein